MQTVLPYLCTFIFILASLPPALPNALHGARPRSSSSPLRSTPGVVDRRRPEPIPRQAGEIKIRSKILIVGWGFRRPFPIPPQHP
ncbi:hypothetical protein JB92DRAFT_2950361 [Gautieria morchelliformis]|nr:hypothetical protein JB92DRAFT_2950361 [Gautieria morchelliformis]